MCTKDTEIKLKLFGEHHPLFKSTVILTLRYRVYNIKHVDFKREMIIALLYVRSEATASRVGHELD